MPYKDPEVARRRAKILWEKNKAEINRKRKKGPRPFNDLTGKTFGRLTIIEHRGKTTNGKHRWLCQCSCGTDKVLSQDLLLRTTNPIKSCSCLRNEKTAARNREREQSGENNACYRHGQTVDGNSPVYNMYQAAKQRAKRDSLAFDIKLQDIVIPEFCPVFPEIRLQSHKRSKGPKDSSPSLDKLIPEQGYTKGNVNVISWKANRIKHRATWQELQKVADWTKEQCQIQ